MQRLATDRAMGVLQPSNALPSLKDSYATVKDDQAYKRKTLQVRVRRELMGYFEGAFEVTNRAVRARF